MANQAKIKVTDKPERVGGSRLLKTVDQGNHYIPETFFMGYNPGTKEATVETFILDQKGIKYKV